jgi:hypothetical protein
MSPAVRQGGAGRCEQRLTSGLPKPTTAPCASLTQLAAPRLLRVRLRGTGGERGQRRGRALPALPARGRFV